ALAPALLEDRARAARGGGLGHGKAPSTRPARGGVPPRNARLPGPRWAATVGRPPARGGPPPRLSSGPMRSRSRFLNAVRSAPPALVGVVFLLAFAYRGLLSPRWGPDTGWYASIATEVYRSGAFWTLRVGPELYFNKPPLAFWIHGAFLQLMGTGLFAMRLPSVLMAAGCVWATAAVAGRLAGPRAALWSA